MGSEAYLLGVDLGTSSVKAVVVARDGSVVGSGTAEYPILHPQPGFAEQDPEAWWQAAGAAVRAAMAAAHSPAIAAIGLSGQMHGAVLLDRHDRPLANAVIWPDQRSSAEVQEITRKVGAELLYSIAGSPVSTGFQAATVRWFQTHAPELWRQVRSVLLPKDYLRWRMTGVKATDPSDGAGALLLDEAERDWSAVLLEALDIPAEILPPVQPAQNVAGMLSSAAAAAWGLPHGIPVVTGAADTACSLLGAGAVTPNDLLLTLSTGGQLAQPSAAVNTDRRGRIHTFCSALEPDNGQAGWYQMGATLNAGMALRWLRDDVLGWRYPDAYDVMNAAAADTPPGADGLLFLPYLVGERTPHMDPAARSVFFGLTLQHGQGHLVRAVQEGVAFACYDAYQVLQELGSAATQIVLAGGGARSPLWTQIIADVFGQPVRPLLVPDQSAVGATILAGAGVGWFTAAGAAAAWVKLGDPVAPDADRHAFYRERFAAFQALYQRNKGQFG